MGQHQTGGEFWRRQQSSGMSLPLSIDGTDRQTDERTDTRTLHRRLLHTMRPTSINWYCHILCDIYDYVVLS